jgi:DNA (cytosine-5)-methyltransferase 1
VSLFSGVGGFDLGLERAGMRGVFQCEIDEYRRRVLARHWPDVDRADDVRGVRSAEFAGGGASWGAVNGTGAPQSGFPDLLCGGFPCQDLSVAGRRRGLDGDRSGLFFEFARIADELRPRWLLVENVPGLLSSADGRDFAIVLRTLADIGYGLAWRVLDARYFGVPQRRRRVFIVGHLGGDPEPAVRVVGAGGEGDLAAGRCSWQDVADGSQVGARVARALTTSQERNGDGFDQDFVIVNIQAQRGKGGGGLNPEETLLAVSALQAPNGRGWRIDAEGAAGGQIQATASGVRRLTPTECERLMSWPDGWTLADEKTADSRRYAACGDGVVSNVAEWIGRRMLAVDSDNQ